MTKYIRENDGEAEENGEKWDHDFFLLATAELRDECWK